MAAKSWQLQDVKLGLSGQPDDDIVMVSLPTPPLAAKDAQDLVRDKMHTLYVNKSSVQGVRIIDDQGHVIARSATSDELNAPRR
jgi:hypothetical protein